MNHPWHVIEKLDDIFAARDVLFILKSDKVPLLNSREFNDVPNCLNVKHQKSTPLWPQANGTFERFMGTLKKVVQRTALEDCDLK